MAEGTYENECNRAELLGLNPPDRIEWEEAERVRKENEQTEQLAVGVARNRFFACFSNLSFIFQEIDNQDEKLTENSGKMDEINSILSMTQMRLNKFKVISIYQLNFNGCIELFSFGFRKHAVV